MDHHLSQRDHSKRHHSIHVRIHRSHLFLRIAEVTTNDALRDRCVVDALIAYGAAVDHFEADDALTRTERIDIEQRLDQLHSELKRHPEIVGRVN